jgi:hypothetical protein
MPAPAMCAELLCPESHRLVQASAFCVTLAGPLDADHSTGRYCYYGRTAVVGSPCAVTRKRECGGALGDLVPRYKRMVSLLRKSVGGLARQTDSLPREPHFPAKQAGVVQAARSDYAGACRSLSRVGRGQTREENCLGVDGYSEGLG